MRDKSSDVPRNLPGVYGFQYKPVSHSFIGFVQIKEYCNQIGFFLRKHQVRSNFTILSSVLRLERKPL